MIDTSTPLAAKTKEAPGVFDGRTQERVTRPDPVVPPVSAKLAEKVSDKLTQKMAEVSARGPEYEAIAKLSREIIEQVVWEVVPELAEVMIREHIERLAAKR